MNTKIPTIIIEALRKENPNEIETACNKIVNTHNSAVYTGFLNLPMVNFINFIRNDNHCELGIRPKSGQITPDEISAIEKAWGANSSTVVGLDNNFVIFLKYNF